MTDDLTARLRSYYDYGWNDDIYIEAADRIDALQAEIKRLQAELDKERNHADMMRRLLDMIEEMQP